ncbi:MAG: DJ-1/PfpI family protein [Methanocorpusculum sp.]|nr:DJ-1/PfpI family protein [Methanocorpusculum sp.]
MQTIYLYTPDTTADWEIGYVLQALGQQKLFGDPAFELKTVAPRAGIIRTIGGLTLTPDLTVDQIHSENAAALLLSGAETWGDPEHAPILKTAASFLEKGILVGAICGATLALADAGILDTRKHTSNSLEFLTQCSANYHGAPLYQNKPAVYDNGLITACSAGGLEWAHELLIQLHIYTPETIENWHSYYTTCNPAYLMKMLGF